MRGSRDKVPDPTDAARRIFVGRVRELAELRGVLEDAGAGRGRLVLITGEAGIGKTRLVDEFVGSIAARGAHVLWGTCQSMGAPPYWPWLQIVRAHVHNSAPARVGQELGPDATAVAQLADTLLDYLAAAPPYAATFAPEHTRFHLFDSLTSFLKNITRLQPLVLVLDDLHWADDASLRLLQFLSSELRDTRLLVIGTYRLDDVHRQHPLSRILGELTFGERLQLAGLSEPDVGRFIGATMDLEPAAAFVTAVHRHTGGNPFFVSEVTRLLATDELLRPAEIAPATLGIPPGVRAVIGRRLERLSDNCTLALTYAAVIGREFDVETVVAASGLCRERIDEALDDAVGARLLVACADGVVRYTFAHELVRAALYGELGANERRRLHHRIGEALEGLHAAAVLANSERILAELAYHFFESATAADTTKAADYAMRAGRQALHLFAFEEAAQQFERARTCLEGRARGPQGGTELCDVLLALGQAQARSGHWRGGRETLLRAADLARRTHDGVRLAKAALSLVNPFPTIGRVDHTRIALLESALRGLPERDHTLRCRIMARLAVEPQVAASNQRREILSRDAVDMARRLGDDVALAHALYGRFWVRMALFPDRDELLGVAGEVIALGRKLGDTELVVQGFNCRIAVFLTVGDVRHADDDIATREECADELKQPFHTFGTHALRATRAMMGGHFESAEALAPQIAATLGREPNAGRMDDLLFFRLCDEQGRKDRVEGMLRIIAAQRASEPGFHAAAAAFYAELEHEADARSHFELAAGDDFRDLPCDANWLTTLTYLARAGASLRDRRRAELLYALLAPHAALHVGALYFSYLGSVAHFLGLLAATLGRYDVAEQHLNAASEMELRVGAAPAVARTHLAHAQMLLLRNQPSDRKRALTHLDQAARAAERLGMKGLERRVAALHSACEPGDTDEEGRAASGAVFRKDGDDWAIAYNGRSIRLKDAKGLGDIAALLARPGDSVHVADLAAAVQSPAETGTDTVIDGRARDAYRTRLAELRNELAEAEQLNDLGRGALARQEMALIESQLAGAYGLGGRARRLATPSSRARAAVTMRIRSAVGKIEKQHPALGRHLARSIKTGTFCSYAPETPVRWNA